jgi:carbon-monoxide dehydrogenase large subunit
MEVNGETQAATVPARTLLVDYLRDHLRLTGTHIGCDDGKCGACTVLVDGAPAKSCLLLAAQADGCAVQTVESLGTPAELSPLQRAFQRHHGLQCGFCTPGMLMSAQALLARNAAPTAAEIRAAIHGNLCRCTGYRHIVEAIAAAAAELRGEKPTPATAAPAAGEAVGAKVERAADRRFLCGLGRYTADFAPGRLLHCAILRSPHAHARIRSVDVSAALELPGVVDVVTGATAATVAGPLPPTINIAMRLNTAHAIAVDTVRYEGEPVAAVAATSPYAAEDALAAIAVEYEVLPAITTAAQALAPDAPRLYEEWADNRCLDWRFARGDVEGALARAAHRIEVRVPHHRYTGVPLEGRAALASFDRGDGRLTVHLSTQSPHVARTLLAQTLRLPEARIHVVTPDVGGGFGVKLQVDAEVIPCILSLRTGRPVLWSETRGEHLRSGIHSRDYEWTIEGGIDGDGRITALAARLVCDNGCDGTNRAAGAGQALVGAFYLPGNYRVPAYAVEVTGVVTNKAPYGAYRGYGKDIANYGIERFMDLAARRIGLDPAEFRRRNFIQPGDFPHELVTGPIYDSGDYPRLLARAEAAIDLPAFRARQRALRASGRHLGVGFGMMLEPAGGAVPNCIFNGYETATVRMLPEGDFMLLSGMQDIGQGVLTTLAQVVADEFRVSPEAVRVVTGDTDAVPYGLGAWSSRGASFGASAAAMAARRLAVRVKRVAAAMLEVPADDVVLDGGGVALAGAPFRRLSFQEIGRAFYLWPGPLVTLPPGEPANLEETCTWTNPIARWVPDAAGGLSIYTTHASGCFAAVVEVDTGTGQIAVERLYVVHDCGNVINPLIVEGQIIGGSVQGLGGVLGEELRYDREGRLLNTGFQDYLIPTAGDVPPVEVEHQCSPSPNTALGTKGMGEGGPVGVPAAIVSAVEDALAPFGVELSELPLSPERILDALRDARAT